MNYSTEKKERANKRANSNRIKAYFFKKKNLKTLDIDNLLRANKRANTRFVSHHQRDGSSDGVFPMCRYIGVCTETCQRHVPTL